MEWARKNPDRKNKYNRDYYLRKRYDPAYVEAETNRKLIARYGITSAEREVMFASQGGKCAICGCDISGYKASNVDHDHKTGQVRELLCGTCNRMAGVLEHELAPSIGAYLSKHRMGTPPTSLRVEGTSLSLPVICSA